jgi:hypothetical protein
MFRVKGFLLNNETQRNFTVTMPVDVLYLVRLDFLGVNGPIASFARGASSGKLWSNLHFKN